MADKQEDRHLLIFDTNVFGRVILPGHESLYDNLFEDINKYFSSTGLLMSTCTPFLMLEYIGQTIPPFSMVLPNEQVIEKLGHELKQWIFEESLKIFESMDCLSDGNIRLKYIHKRDNYVSAKAMKLYEDIVGAIASKSNCGYEIRYNLAIDMTYKTDYRKFISNESLKRFHINTLIDIYANYHEGKNITQIRGLFDIADELRRENKDHPIDVETKKLLNWKEGVKPFKDFADLDHIQMTCLGACIATELMPVTVYTRDPKEAIEGRLRSFKATFEVFSNHLEESGLAKEFDYIRDFIPQPGKIIILDDNMIRTDVIEVSTS